MHLLIHIFPYDKWLIYIDYIMIYHIKAVWCDTYKNHVEEWTLSDGPGSYSKAPSKDCRQSKHSAGSWAKKELLFPSRNPACIMLLHLIERNLNISHNIFKMPSKTLTKVSFSEDSFLSLGEVHIYTHSNSGSACKWVINKLYKREHSRLEAAYRIGPWLVSISLNGQALLPMW